MRKLLAIALLFSAFAMAQNSNQISVGIGFVQQDPLIEELDKTNEPVFSVGLQTDLFTKSDFVLGPEVRVFATKGDNKLLPNIIVGGLTGYDNGKFRFVGGLSGAPREAAERYIDKSNEPSYFKGIFTTEVGLGAFFVRGEWYTNLQTYFYSYTAQVGFRITL